VEDNTKGNISCILAAVIVIGGIFAILMGVTYIGKVLGDFIKENPGGFFAILVFIIVLSGVVFKAINED